MIDPRLNCAAEICCAPSGLVETVKSPSHKARVEILVDLGLDHEAAGMVSLAMKKVDLCFMPQAIADIMREIAFPAST